MRAEAKLRGLQLLELNLLGNEEVTKAPWDQGVWGLGFGFIGFIGFTLSGIYRVFVGLIGFRV